MEQPEAGAQGMPVTVNSAQASVPPMVYLLPWFVPSQRKLVDAVMLPFFGSRSNELRAIAALVKG